MTDHESAVLAENAAREQLVIAEVEPANVAVTVIAGPEVKMLAGMARDMEANGDTPELHWYRGDGDEIKGIILTGHLSRETQAAVAVDVRPMGAVPL